MIYAIFNAVDRYLTELPRAALIQVAVAGVVIIGYADSVVGLEVSFALFYLGPVACASWYVGRPAGALIATLSIFPLTIARWRADYLVTNPGLMLWDALVQLGMMLLIAYLLDKLHAALSAADELAATDQLTGLLNRRALYAQTQYHFKVADRTHNPFTIVYIDLDNFKVANDQCGHAEGDRILQFVASTLIRTLRSTDYAARLGGDEFVLPLPWTDEHHARVLAEKLHVALEQVFRQNASAVSTSIGCLTLASPMPKMEAAIALADKLMYHVKKQGKNHIAFGKLLDNRLVITI